MLSFANYVLRYNGAELRSELRTRIEGEIDKHEGFRIDTAKRYVEDEQVRLKEKYMRHTSVVSVLRELLVSE